MDLILSNLILLLLCSLVNSSSIDLRAVDFFLQSPPQYIWSRVINASVPEGSISPACHKQLNAIHLALKSEVTWPYRFLDASANLPSGFLDGTISSLGDYDQCVSIESPDEEAFIRGSYCMVKFTKVPRECNTPVQDEITNGLFLYDALPLSLAICLPDACTSEQDIYSLLESTSSFARVSREHEIICDSTESDTRRLFTFTTSQLLASVYLVCLYVLLALGTICHHYRWSNNRFLLCFSLKKSLNTLIKPPEKRNTVVDDVRWLMAFTVVIIHSFACATEFRAIAKISRLKVDFWNKFQWFIAQPYFNVIGIDGFFTIAGLATVWSVSRSINQGNVVKNSLRLLLSRWLRFGPSLITLLAIEMLWPKFGSGPMYTELTSYIYKSCESTWWMTILGMNNIGNDPSNTCLVHTWYLSAEFQLFILAIVALILMQAYPFWGKVYCLCMTLIGMILPAVKAYNGHIPAATIHRRSFDDINMFIREMYFPAYCHLTPFFIGLLTSISIQEGQLNLDLARKYKKTLLLLFSGLIFSVYFPAYWNTFKYPLEPITSALYSLLHRLIFTLGLLSSIAIGLLLKDWIVSISKNLSHKYTVNVNNNISNTSDIKYSVRSINNNNNRNMIHDKDEETKKSQPNVTSLENSSIAMKNMRIVFKCTSQLYFSLYLTHSNFIRYHFFTSRSMFIFDTQCNIIRAGYCFTFAMQLALLFFLAVERPFEELRYLILAKDKSKVI